ncbi:MAG: hypothetical protein H7125_17955 [Proteobacteria bacterium]|nr:hypothetical protein [Burkholderiales bacterium]
MIFMSQSGITDPARASAWDAWYLEHLALMRTVPGISSAQRFGTLSADAPPSLAMYSVTSPDVFRDPYYLSVRGMGEWREWIDPRFYRRNLFAGLDFAPGVGAGSVMLVADRGTPDAPGAGAAWICLTAAGIDESTPYRLIAVCSDAEGVQVARRTDCALYRPVTFDAPHR